MADLPPPSRDLVFFGMNLVHMASGTAGGIVRGLVARHYTWTMRISTAVVGGLTAGYFTPPAVHIVRWLLEQRGYPVAEIEGSVGFFIGLCGMTICEAVIRWARRWRDGSLPPTFT